MLIWVEWRSVEGDCKVVISISTVENLVDTSLERLRSITMTKTRQNLFNIVYNITLKISHESTKIGWRIKKISRSAGVKIGVLSWISLAILNHNLERAFEVRDPWVLKLSLNILEVFFFLSLIPIFCFDPIFWWLILKSIWINLSDGCLKKNVWLDREKSGHVLAWSQFGCKVSLEESVNHVRFRSEIPHEFFYNFLFRVDNCVSCLNGFLLAGGLILRIFIHHSLQSLEELSILRSIEKSMWIGLANSIPSFSVTRDVCTEFDNHMIREDVEYSGRLFTVNSKSFTKTVIDLLSTLRQISKD